MKSTASTLKKICIEHRSLMLSVFFACLLSFSFLMPLAADAQSFSKFKVPFECNTKECGWDDFVRLAQEVLQFAIYLAVLCATVSFVYAGFKMMTNMGNDGEISKAKKIIYSAAIGLVITMAAWLIVDFILDKLMVEQDFRYFIK